MELHPLAKHYNTPENYKLLSNWVDAHNSIQIEFDNEEFERELAKIKNKIDDSIAKIFK